MIPVVERKGEINMGTVTGRNLVDVKKQDTIYKFVDSDSAWFSRATTGREYDNPSPRGILCLACRNMHTEDKYFAVMVLEDMSLAQTESPDFDTLDGAIGWLQEKIELLIIALDLPANLPEWVDIPKDLIRHCYGCHHFAGYRENRDGGKGQGQYFSCRAGHTAVINCPNFLVKSHEQVQ